VPIFRITSSNVSAVLPSLQIPDDVRQDIINATSANLVVLIPASDVRVGSYSGLGYVIEDPTNGTAGYLISGGRAGGNAPAAKSVYPLPSLPSYGATSIILGGAQRSQAAAPILPLVAATSAVTGIDLSLAEVEFLPLKSYSQFLP
jgi:hypothetical protein